MKNWKEIASGSQLGIPDEEIERIVPTMNALEAVFRPLVKDIPHETEPAVIFHASEDPA